MWLAYLDHAYAFLCRVVRDSLIISRYVPSQYYITLCPIPILYIVICAIPICGCDVCQSLMTYVYLSLVLRMTCQSVQFGWLSESSPTDTVVGLFSGGLRVFIAFDRAFSFLPHASLLLRGACVLAFFVHADYYLVHTVWWIRACIVCTRARPLETERVWSKFRMIVSMIHHSLSILSSFFLILLYLVVPSSIYVLFIFNDTICMRLRKLDMGRIWVIHYSS